MVVPSFPSLSLHASHVYSWGSTSGHLHPVGSRVCLVSCCSMLFLHALHDHLRLGSVGSISEGSTSRGKAGLPVGNAPRCNLDASNSKRARSLMPSAKVRTKFHVQMCEGLLSPPRSYRVHGFHHKVVFEISTKGVHSMPTTLLGSSVVFFCLSANLPYTCPSEKNIEH